MSAERFVEKWSRAELSERAASHEHFIDLCRLLGEPTPAEADPEGESYCFEKAVKVVRSASKGSKGDSGFVDVWKRGFFAWEYKRKDKYKSLDDAYGQLYQYRDALDNPPLSVVCDIRNFVIRAHFPGYPTAKVEIRLEEVPAKLGVLRWIFQSPGNFRPAKSREETTKDIAEVFADLANGLIERQGIGLQTLFTSAGDPVAHFLMKVMFCLFAEKIGQLPPDLFTKLINRCIFDPEQFQPLVAELFEKMKKGGWYGNDRIEYFNGGLFDDAEPLPLTDSDIRKLRTISEKPWAGVEPTIFGTLFERILDPKKRAQIGAHYTSKDDILLVVEPVVMAPLRREWDALRSTLQSALEEHDAEPNRKKRDFLAAPIKVTVEEFRRRLGRVRVLDPACGSGNFLYVTLQRLLDLEDEVVRFCALHDIYVDAVPRIRPPAMHGIEINPYAAELAQVVIWIGYLQWLHEHNIDDPRRPILDKLQCIENRDAILDLTDKKNPAPAKWPEADFIVGNPPFLGVRLFRSNGLSDAYLAALQQCHNLPRTSDLCCYWFEIAHSATRRSPVRVGLLATQAIRGTDNREVLIRIAADSTIYWAWSNREWTTEGADVRVSMIGFAASAEKPFLLDGLAVERINADLSSGADATTARTLKEMAVLSFQGPVKVGPFEVDTPTARELLAAPVGAAPGATTSVVKRWYNGSAITKRWPGDWIIDFATMSEREAAFFEAPFDYVARVVKPVRQENRRESRAERWWLFGEPNPKMREKLGGLVRFIATPRVSKYRLYVWLKADVIPDGRVVGIAADTDYVLGILQSTIHELWALGTGSWHGVGNDLTYNNTVSFDTFVLPWPPGKEDVHHPAYAWISEAAKELNELRERWLNPPEWIEPIAQRIDEQDTFADIPAEARPLIRQSAIMAAAAKDVRLKKRTLTNLYNERPTWLRLAHEKLDRAVLAAYAAVDPAGNWDESWAEVWVDAGAGQPLPKNHPLAARRAEAEQAVLANLLRMNHERAGR